MAKVTSGSFDTGSKNNRYLTFSWTCSQNISTNESTINWELKCNGTATNYNKAAPFYVEINGDQVYYSTTRINLYVGNKVASGSKTIKHNADGTKSFSASVKAAIYDGAYNVSGSGSWDLKDIPRGAKITEAPNFNDEQNPTIKYSNPAGNSVTTLQACISFDKSADNIAYRDISKTGSSYTFNLTAAEREVLRKATLTSTTKTVYFYIKTIVGGNTFYSSIAKTLSIVNAIPTITTTVEETSFVNLTGNSKTIIKGYNTVNVSMLAYGQKGATIKKHEIINGDSKSTNASITLTDTEDNVVVCKATDSRGITISQPLTLNMINYIPLTVNVDGIITLSEIDNTKAELSYTITGNCFNGSFGVVNNNLRFIVRIIDEDGNIVDLRAIAADYTVDNNKYTITKTATDLDYQKSYIVEVEAIDALNKVKGTSKALKAVPMFDWGESDFNFNVPVTYKGIKLFYTSGDSVSFYGASANFAGCVSDTTKTLYFTIPLCKPVMADKVSLSGSVIGRGINGYVNGTGWADSTAINMNGSTGYTVTTHLRETGVDVLVTFTSAITNATNNTPVNLHPYGTLTLTFN